MIELTYFSRKGVPRILNFVTDIWKMSVKEVFLRVILSDISGDKVSFLPFDCNRELFAAERTNVDAFGCNA